MNYLIDANVVIYQPSAIRSNGLIRELCEKTFDRLLTLKNGHIANSFALGTRETQGESQSQGLNIVFAMNLLFNLVTVIPGNKNSEGIQSGVSKAG